MKRLVIMLALILLLLVPVACSMATEVESGPVPAPTPKPGPTEYLRDIGGSGLPSAEERMIVRNSDISLVVQDIPSARDEITALAVGYGGYVVSSNIYGEEEELKGNITIRVPDDKFDTALAKLRVLAIRVTRESTDSRDVTEEYIDLESRLKNAEATERQYLSLLEKAEDVEDALRIYERLSQIRQEIEQVKGRMQYLERVSSMSLISIELRPEASTKPLARAGWNALEVLKSAVRGLVTTAQIIGTLIIWLIIFSPIWGTILGIIMWRRRKKKIAQSRTGPG